MHIIYIHTMLQLKVINVYGTVIKDEETKLICMSSTYKSKEKLNFCHDIRTYLCIRNYTECDISEHGIDQFY